MAGNDPLERLGVRRKLQRELADGSLTQEALGAKYGVTQQAVSAFAKRHAETIQAMREDAENEFAGLLLAKKANRLAALEELYHKALEPTPKVTPAGKVVIAEYDADGKPVYVQEIDGRLAAQVIKQTAEELGQLPNRVTLGGEVGIKTNYKIEGVDPEGLK